jgi:hypothetical protein
VHGPRVLLGPLFFLAGQPDVLVIEVRRPHVEHTWPTFFVRMRFLLSPACSPPQLERPGSASPRRPRCRAGRSKGSPFRLARVRA